MALEIERRFLVEGEQWRAHVVWQRRLQQGYLSASADGVTTRVRSDGAGSAWLTLKAAAAQDRGGLVRHEFEYAIPLADAQALLELAPAGLSKQRHGLDLPGGEWVLDVFEQGNAPLVIAEVELPSADQGVAVPSWCVREITGQGRFSNAALASSPWQSWSAAEQEPWLSCVRWSPDCSS